MPSAPFPPTVFIRAPPPPPAEYCPELVEVAPPPNDGRMQRSAKGSDLSGGVQWSLSLP